MSYALYRWFDVSGVLLYIGKTGELSQRVSSHLSRSRWMQLAASSTVERFGTAEDIGRAEREAIKAERPIFNRQYNDTPEAQERLRAYLEAIDRTDLLPKRRERADRDVIPALWEGDADIIDQIHRILSSPCRHHALIRLMVIMLVDGYREFPSGRDLELLGEKARVERATAYRLVQLARAQSAAA